MGIDKGTIRLGLAKQAAKGTLAANPAYLFGAAAGSGIKTDIKQDRLALSSAAAASGAVDRTEVGHSASIDYRAFQGSLGLLLLGAQGAVATTGAADPYTHIFSLTSAKPYLSVFEEFIPGGATNVALRDAVVNSLGFKWTKNEALQISADLLGTVLSFPATITAGTNETDLKNYFTPVGGTFKLAVDSATPVTASIKAGDVTLANKAEADFFCGAIEAGDVSALSQEASCSFTLVPNDLSVWRTIVTGSASGAGVSSSPVLGSFEVTFTNGTHSLKLEASQVAFLCDLPTVDPYPAGNAEVAVAGPVLYSPTLAACVKVTLINGVASY